MLKKKSFDLVELDSNVSVFNKAQWYRLMKWKDDKINTGIRNLDYAFESLSGFCTRLDLDDSVKNRVVDVYDECFEHGLLKGRSVEVLMGTCVYVGLRLEGVARTSSEVAEVCKITEKEILRTTRIICKELNIRLPLVSPKDFIPRFCNSLGVSDIVQTRALELVEDCEVAGLCNGPSPASICAVCLYVACLECSERRTQRDIGEVCGVTDVTIRNLLRKVKDKLDIIL